MLSRHYHWTVNLGLGAVIVLAHFADRVPEWKSYLVAGCGLATLPALVVYFKRQCEPAEKP